MISVHLILGWRLSCLPLSPWILTERLLHCPLLPTVTGGGKTQSPDLCSSEAHIPSTSVSQSKSQSHFTVQWGNLLAQAETLWGQECEHLVKSNGIYLTNEQHFICVRVQHDPWFRFQKCVFRSRWELFYFEKKKKSIRVPINWSPQKRSMIFEWQFKAFKALSNKHLICFS